MPSSQKLSSKLEEILTRTVSCIGESKNQIFEIVESSRREIDRIESKLSLARQELSELSGKIRKRKEACCEESGGGKEENPCEEELAILREKREETQQRINQLVKRIKVMEKVPQRSESLVSRMGVVNDFLQGRMIDISSKFEDFSSREDFIYKIIEAHEKERRRVAREIHDGPAQLLANLVLRVEIVQRMIDKNKEEASRELEELKKIVKNSVTDVRKIIYALRPMSLEELGLVPTLRKYIDRFVGETEIGLDFEVLGEAEKLPSSIEVTIFRLIQEGLNNIKKHAQASSGRVVLEFDSQNIKILIADDGQGFDSDEKLENSYGLASMNERCSLLQGDFQIKSNPGQGTRIDIRLPVKHGG